MTPAVALVFVSHSGLLAQGIVDLCRQMAPTTVMIPAGGLEDGSLGTSFDTIAAAIERAAGLGDDSEDPLRDVVVLADLGSAVLSTQSVMEFLPAELEGRITLASAPFVEGGVAAAVSAEGGAPAADVARSAHQAMDSLLSPLSATEHVTPPGVEGSVSQEVEVLNSLGLHARPAAVLARLIASFDAHVTLNGADGSSVIEIMKLGVSGGQRLVITAQGPQAEEALTAVVRAITEGFGELA
ncbi:dihydroxyacetone kinase phosphoryl donor subunit DhaM [Jonesia quinghaiensis]|uniref:dihydroxyacetone kinase phosphoryl donor subunit DhaM n=1 Tax=Jonesia quinghaiensis TaxID=262806 RepID=UPI000425B8A6|nr:dihydroxyacetone kinase phosphoryl donor subunit DhaM [Jonesia quinghaiensis]